MMRQSEKNEESSFSLNKLKHRKQEIKKATIIILIMANEFLHNVYAYSSLLFSLGALIFSFHLSSLSFFPDRSDPFDSRFGES